MINCKTILELPIRIKPIPISWSSLIKMDHNREGCSTKRGYKRLKNRMSNDINIYMQKF